MRSTEASRRMKVLRSAAAEGEREAKTLDRVDGLDPAARVRREEAARLRLRADDLRPTWRLENLAIFQVEKTKTTKKDEARTYTYWHASWREGEKVRTVYLGSAKKMSEAEALEKACKLKANALGL